MRFLYLGDIVGPPGVQLVRQALPAIRKQHRLDAIFANAENAAGGSGLTPNIYKQLRIAGVDGITLGDHIYKKFDIADILRDPTQPIVKPANYPAEAAGRNHHILTFNDVNVCLISLMGRTFMRAVDCPFHAIDNILNSIHANIIIVDIHAEATADKYQMLHYLKGRVTALLGTHTHVPTADEQILTGTAFQCDLGMCGPYGGVIGRAPGDVLHHARTFEPSPFDIATNDIRLAGAIVTFEESTGKATAIERVMWKDADCREMIRLHPNQPNP